MRRDGRRRPVGSRLDDAGAERAIRRRALSRVAERPRRLRRLHVAARRRVHLLRPEDAPPPRQLQRVALHRHLRLRHAAHLAGVRARILYGRPDLPPKRVAMRRVAAQRQHRADVTLPAQDLRAAVRRRAAAEYSSARRDVIGAGRRRGRRGGAAARQQAASGRHHHRHAVADAEHVNGVITSTRTVLPPGR